LLSTVTDLQALGVRLTFGVEDLATGWHWYLAQSFLTRNGVHGPNPDFLAKRIGT
jgi:hypothetical protein